MQPTLRCLARIVVWHRPASRVKSGSPAPTTMDAPLRAADIRDSAAQEPHLVKAIDSLSRSLCASQWPFTTRIPALTQKNCVIPTNSLAMTPLMLTLKYCMPETAERS